MMHLLCVMILYYAINMNNISDDLNSCLTCVKIYSITNNKYIVLILIGILRINTNTVTCIK